MLQKQQVVWAFWSFLVPICLCPARCSVKSRHLVLSVWHQPSITCKTEIYNDLLSRARWVFSIQSRIYVVSDTCVCVQFTLGTCDNKCFTSACFPTVNLSNPGQALEFYCAFQIWFLLLELTSFREPVQGPAGRNISVVFACCGSASRVAHPRPPPPLGCGLRRGSVPGHPLPGQTSPSLPPSGRVLIT